MAARQILQAYRPGFFDRLLNKKDSKMQQLYEEIETAKIQDEELLKEWTYMHNIAGRMLNRDIEAYFEVIQEFDPLEDLVGMGSGFEFGTDNPNVIHVSFDVNAQNVVPQKSLSLTKTGKLSEKNLTKTMYYDIYQDYVCSCALRIARDMFALLPIAFVYVHAYENRLNSATGYQEKIAILSVKYDKVMLNRLNITNLDPSEALTNFNYQMKFKKTQGFEAVQLVLN